MLSHEEEKELRMHRARLRESILGLLGLRGINEKTARANAERVLRETAPAEPWPVELAWERHNRDYVGTSKLSYLHGYRAGMEAAAELATQTGSGAGRTILEMANKVPWPNLLE